MPEHPFKLAHEQHIKAAEELINAQAAYDLACKAALDLIPFKPAGGIVPTVSYKGKKWKVRFVDLDTKGSNPPMLSVSLRRGEGIDVINKLLTDIDEICKLIDANS